MDKWEYKSLKFEVKGFFGGVLDTEQFDSVANSMVRKAGTCFLL